MIGLKLLLNGLIKFLCGFLIVSLLIFLPAGTFNYINGWFFISVMFIPIFIMGIVLLFKAPDLLKKRLDSREEDNTQKGVVLFSVFIFLGGFIVAGLDFRFRWSYVPKSVTIISSIIFLVSYALYAIVMRENAYLSRTVKVEENQKVIDTGLYGIVRHPMYTATIIMFLMIPLILGSWWAFVIFLLYPLVIVMRVLDEEKILTNKLNGYKEYKQKVKYRLIPFIW